MDIFYIVLAHILWFAAYFAVMRVGLSIEDRVHKSAVKKWGQDIQDHEFNRLKFKIFVSLFFIGVPILFWIGFVVHYTGKM